MSPRTNEQNEIIRQQKRQQILDAALVLFAHNGFHNSSISALAKSAGVAKGLVYNYFESKDEILKALLLLLFEEIDVFNDMFPEGMGHEEALGQLLDHYIKEIETKGDHWRLYYSLILQIDIQKILGPEIEKALGPVMEKIAAFFVNQGCEHPMDEAFLFGSMMDGVFLNYLMNPQYVDLRKMKDIIVRRFT